MIMDYEYYINKCIELAKNGEGKVEPNPLVGAVVLDKEGNIAGCGYHQKYGEAHAEVNALNQAKNKAKDGTIFINLEPCSHYGKTPPCADLIIEKGIKKAVIGMIDPNPQVSGQGIEKLKRAGIEVITGILENKCKKLNEIFIKNITCKESFISIKSAITLDGKIATKTGSSKWITSEDSRNEVQKLRNKYDAILTGSGTVIADNPSLTCKNEGGRNPIRIIVDSKLITSSESKVYAEDKTKIFVAVAENIDQEKRQKFSSNITFLECPPVDKEGHIDLEFLIKELYKKGINSILVEAGGKLNGELIKQNLVDKFYIFVAPKILGDNEGKTFVEGFEVSDINNCINLGFADIRKIGKDLLIILQA
ncbi:MAG: bifunctional diaminohydroxyphosphoribosylaminopyrimidine deaminase/5-amino-6-(5-phosphoribosylamino)uracil reductase RibD [Candidatus Gastranaerophilaceae bacterium]|jgi:diaminohydroxyphosphoribosylaminopyrimidine deaminase/5-amino-6-(5-phosphoribosylamino)uracil reductase